MSSQLDASGSASLTGCNQDGGWGCDHLKAQLGRACFQAQLLAGFSSSLAVGQRPPSLLVMGLLPGQLTTWQLAFLRVSKGQIKRASKMEVSLL